MKSLSVLAVAFLGAALVMAGCTIRIHGEATTSAKVKAGAKTESTHPVVEAKPVDEPQPVAEGGVAKAGVAVEAKVAVGIKVPKIAEGAKAKEVACPNTTEVTNGIDDDCDGQIDENEVGSGPLQITLWWDGPADIDLKVQPPKGDVINYKNKKSAGGYMDRDSRSSCKNGGTIENVFWTESPPKGIYTVTVKYYSNCKDKTEAPAAANVTVSYKNQILGPYSIELAKGEEVEILQFNLEE